MKKLLKLLLIKIPVALIILSVTLVFFYKWVPVRLTPLMIRRAVEFRADEDYSRRQTWVQLEDISKGAVRTIVASEDDRFMTHGGFDFVELRKMMEDHLDRGKKLRGCSTISQQTAKNCFTWCSDTWLRKGVEAWFTILIEKIWGKRRILEVYLNVAEMGKGIYGIGAASEHYWKIEPSQLDYDKAASLALCLPSPLKRSPSSVSNSMGARKQQLIRLGRASTLDL